MEQTKQTKQKEQTEQEIATEVKRQKAIILKGVEQVVEEELLERKLERSIRDQQPLRVKLGLDPSAPDIHLGHAVVLRKLKQMQDLGHQIIIIIGDFTGQIGDPTGKSKGRQALSSKQVLVNAMTYQEQIFQVLSREKTEVRYNGEWLELLQFKDVLELAMTTTVARMLERDDFQKRFNSQTFNILMGRSLQKSMGMEPQVALFLPILEGLDGKEKMSKSLGNYIGVFEPANVMFKKVMEVPDHLIVRYFTLATDELPETIGQIAQRLEKGENPRDIKLELARIITSLYHTAEETALRRLVMQGGVSVNGEKANDIETALKNNDVLKLGKKQFVKLQIK